MKVLRVLLSTVLVSSALFVSTAGASADACEQVWVDNYAISIHLDDDTYRIGDTVDVLAAVTRKSTGDAVSGVDVGVILLSRKDRYAIGYDRTDGFGWAHMRIDLTRKNVTPGPVRLKAVAYQRLADTTCATVGEYGYRHMRNAFAVRP